MERNHFQFHSSRKQKTIDTSLYEVRVNLGIYPFQFPGGRSTRGGVTCFILMDFGGENSLSSSTHSFIQSFDQSRKEESSVEWSGDVSRSYG